MRFERALAILKTNDYSILDNIKIVWYTYHLRDLESLKNSKLFELSELVTKKDILFNKFSIFFCRLQLKKVHYKILFFKNLLDFCKRSPNSSYYKLEAKIWDIYFKENSHEFQDLNIDGR